MAGSANNDNDEIISAINVTPLVDIVLVLLIVFMVTSSYLVNKSINVELPKAATGETNTNNTTLSISLDIGGNLFLDGKAIDGATLRQRIHSAYAANPDVKAVISADRQVTHGQVVSIIDMLRSEKITKFAINTSPLETKETK